MIQVKATREGLLGGKTSSGYLIDAVVPFVALPSRAALGKFIRVVNPANGKQCLAVVLDVGPWNIADDAYVFQQATASPTGRPLTQPVVRPQAEGGLSLSGKGTNGAGIDLGEKVWSLLTMQDNTPVAWGFIE